MAADQSNALKCDVLIVGAGAAGAVAAHELARQNIDVLCLEQGEWPDTDRFVGRREEHEIVASPRWDPDPNVRLQMADYPIDVSESDVDIINFNGVGGSTVVWNALWHRLLPSDFRVRTLDGVAADWPISYDELAPFYDEVEEAMGVSGLAGDPAYPARGPYPLPAFPIERMGIKFAEAMNRLGWHWWPGINAIPSRPWRRLNACVRRGVCGMGCADGAKAATYLTHWPDAVEAGARLVTGARVRELTLDENGLADGAIFFDGPGNERIAYAKSVIVCANGIGTARLMLLSKSARYPDGIANSSGLVGRGLMLHPTSLVTGLMNEPMETWHGPMGQIANSMEFYETDASRGFVRGSKWSLVASGGPLGFASGMPMHGEALQQAMQRMYGKTMSILVISDDLPDDDNRVVLDDELTDADDLPAPKILYRVPENTRRNIAFNLDRAAEALREAGAVETYPISIGRHFGGAHLMGTARMGDNPETSVVDRWGRCHDIPNLHIFDGSVFVTGGGVNPTATICAIALRCARHLAEAMVDVRVSA